MAHITNTEDMNAPFIPFSGFPEGMAEKIEVGDTVVVEHGPEQATAEVMAIDQDQGRVYLTKELPWQGADISVKETSNGEDSRYDAVREKAQENSQDDSMAPLKDAVKGPLPDLKKLLIQISISQE